MITLYSFCSPARATGKTTMMSSFLRDDAETIFFAHHFERWEVRRNFKQINPIKIIKLDSHFFRGLSPNNINFVINVPYLESMRGREFEKIKYACNYLTRKTNINVYVESLKPILVDKLISAINPDNIMFFDDYLNWDENNHAIGEEISLINKANQSIKDKGFRYFGINSNQHKDW